MKMFNFNSAPDSEPKKESLGLNNIPMYLAKADRGIKSTKEFIEGLEKLLENKGATEEQKKRWSKDIIEAKVMLAQLQTEQSELMADVSNENSLGKIEEAA